MASLFKGLVFLASLATFAYSFYVVGLLVLFLSTPRSVAQEWNWVFNLLDNRARLETAYGPVVFDTLYLIGFILQHSLLKSAIVKKLLAKLGLSGAERTIYSLTSSICLHYLIQNWMSAPSIVLWQVNAEKSAPIWWAFVFTHALCWIVIFGGSLVMDLAELLGVKQAYYDLRAYEEPVKYKSSELRNLYAHVRHPSFVGLSLILLATNVMSADRLILALLLITYMYVAWSTDRRDVAYQKVQLQRKKLELKAH